MEILIFNDVQIKKLESEECYNKLIFEVKSNKGSKLVVFLRF